MSIIGHHITLALALVALTGTAAAQSRDEDASMWEAGSASVASPAADRGGNECGQGNVTCPSAVAGSSVLGDPQLAGTAGVSGTPGSTLPMSSGPGSAALPAGPDDGAAMRQW